MTLMSAIVQDWKIITSILGRPEITYNTTRIYLQEQLCNNDM